MIKHILLSNTVAALVTLISAEAIPFSACNQTGLFPHIADTSRTTPETANFFYGYFTAKSSDNASAWISYFNPNQTQYYDATIGAAYPNYTAWTEAVTAITQVWAKNASSGRSYPLRILGDTTTGALINFVDTPPLFGAELRILSSVDFLNGKVRRQVDNWDGRGNAEAAQTVPDDQYPYDLGLTGLPENAATVMKTTAMKLNTALSTGNATAAAALFNYNAIFEDMTLRTKVEGQIAIQAYLQRAVQHLPYGRGANLTHVVGNEQGGGYEWRPSASPIKYGISALELDCSGNITRYTTVWDGARLNTTAIQNLALLALSP